MLLRNLQRKHKCHYYEWMISALTPQVHAFHYRCVIRPTTVTTVCRHHIFDIFRTFWSWSVPFKSDFFSAEVETFLSIHSIWEVLDQSVAVLEILKGEVESNLSAPSYFIANEHNELYAFHLYWKGDLLNKIMRPVGGTSAPTAPLSLFEFATFWPFSDRLARGRDLDFV